MSLVWKRPNATVREICDDVAARRPIAYTTVMTTMDRLFQKGLLSRSREGNAYRYSARLDRSRWVRSWSERVIDGLVPSLDRVSMAYFVEEARKTNPELLAHLRRLIDGADDE
jgi:predicted transcriptional regulator